MTGITEGWGEFFVAEVGAAAALTGLVIVAISINLKRILEGTAMLVGRAAEALLILAGALVVVSAGLIPHQPPRVLGLEMLGIGCLVLATCAVLQARALIAQRRQPLQWWLPRLLVALATTAPIIVGGLMIAGGSPEGLYWIAAGVLLSLAAGVLNTWVLLIEILR
jgi:hypothetical protein